MSHEALGRAIYAQALRCGFDDCGVLPLDAADSFAPLYRQRLRSVPQSQFFYNGVGDLAGTKKRFPWAAAIVILTFHYGKYRYPKELQGRYAKAFFLEPGQHSSAAYDLPRFEQWFAEHRIRAEGGTRFGAVSIGPLRHFAVKAGLGILRKNNFFYTEQGSYHQLFGYVIDRACVLTRTTRAVPCAEGCDLCQRACKTRALQAPYTMDPLRCVSFWTTFGNSGVPQGMTPELLEEWVCGCDNCQDACPYNRRHDWEAGVELPGLKELAPMLLPQNYDLLSDEFLVKQVVSRSAGHLQAADLPALRRNAARALAFRQAKQEPPGR